MTDNELKIIVGALLHDLGKVLYRSGDGRTHSQSGAEFLEEMGIKDPGVADMVRYHHASDLKSAGLENDSPAYIVYIADNIAAAADRRGEEGDVKKGFDQHLPLESIFNSLNGNHQKMHYRPSVLDDRSGCNMPTDETIGYDSSFYSRVREEIKNSVKGIDSVSREYIESLLCVLEAYCSFIPSSTATHERADISLYDHVKMTAAYAACIYQYLEEKGVSDYREVLYQNTKNFYDEKAFLLMSVDLSGIQKFLYTIHSEGALRMLRSRSFYLEILMEHIIDLLLEGMELTRANLIYSGGGHCYIIGANTKKTVECLSETMKAVNQFFMEQFDVALYAAAGSVPCSANDLENKPNGSYQTLFRQLSFLLGENKRARYSAADILRLNQKKHKDSRRECRICKQSDELDEKDRCRFCAALEDFSGQILYKDFFTVFCEKKQNSLALPGGCFLKAQTEDEIRGSIEGDHSYIRVYSKNRFYTGRQVATRLWVGDYTQKNLTTEDYAKAAKGINRIAVLRADVDNLGKAFVSGFAPEYTTLSRTATFSRMLSLFFKHHINTILSNPEYGMQGPPGKQRNATIVYSGGDDVFLVGSWDDVLELAVDLRDKLKQFSQGTLTISAGIGIYSAKYPMSVCAEETAWLEDASKSYPDSKNPEKDSVTVFGAGQTYRWDCWKEKVVGEKLKLLLEYLEEFQERGNAFLYHLLQLIRGMDDRINLARFAYVLTRLEPKDEKDLKRKEKHRAFVRTMYGWVQNKEDQRQLITAIYLYVYLHRSAQGGE